jgi:hypothetical protein
MGVRVGTSHRTRHGSVWWSAPLSVVALVALVVLPFFIEYVVIKTVIIVIAWVIQAVYDYR